MDGNSSSDSDLDRPPQIQGLQMLNLSESPAHIQPKSSLKSAGNISTFLNSHKDLGKIGEGNNGSVHLYRKLKNGKNYAVKIMQINEETESIVRKNFLQVRTLRTAPNLVKYRQMYCDLSAGICYLVMEYYDFPKLDPLAGYPQQELKDIVDQILNGLKALHKKNFYHRDIKPDNILYNRKEHKIVIVDLGVGRMVKKGEASTIAGTPAYRAPEMGKAGYGSKVDIYALGITIYELVTGMVPSKKFKYSGINKIQNTLAEEPASSQQGPQFDQKQWEQYSNRLKDLIKRMIKKQPSERYDASECLSHPWFIKDISPKEQLQKNKQQHHYTSQQEKVYKSQVQKKSMYEFQGNSYQNKTMTRLESNEYEHNFEELEYIQSPVPIEDDEDL